MLSLRILSVKDPLFYRCDGGDRSAMSTVIMDESAVKRSLARITHEIIEHNRGAADICLVGIRRRGASVARAIFENIQKFENVTPPLGFLDITFYRDDLSTELCDPSLSDTEIGFDVTGQNIILTDDVIYTGRTCRAAIEAIFRLGRPASIQFAVLIDRGHRELPLRPDYVGKNVPTSKDEIIPVATDEYDGETCVRLTRQSD